MLKVLRLLLGTLCTTTEQGNSYSDSLLCRAANSYLKSLAASLRPGYGKRHLRMSAVCRKQSRVLQVGVRWYIDGWYQRNTPRSLIAP